jgi:hypothetical protein
MSKISDELRKYVRENTTGSAFLKCLADRMDSEMVEIPRDRDGVPIHVGDTVYMDDGRKGKVTRIVLKMGEDSVHTIVYCDNFLRTPGYLTHIRPDSWERIADELESWCDGADVDGDACEKPHDLAERIRKLAKECK